MVDRLEELLAGMDDEDEEEQEDVLTLTARTVPAAVSLKVDDGEIAAAEQRDDPAGPDSGEAEHSAGQAMDGGGAPIPASPLVEGGEHSADGAAGMDGGVSAEEPGRPAGETANGSDEDDSNSEEKPEAGLVWRLDGGAVQKAEAAWRRALADRMDEAVAEAIRMTAEGTVGTAAERLSMEKGGELARMVRHEAESGLEGLYRQTVQAGRPVLQAMPAEQAGRTVRAEEPGRTAALTVDELDRAVRRDSRRYDGGMMIY